MKLKIVLIMGLLSLGLNTNANKRITVKQKRSISYTILSKILIHWA